MQLRFMAVALTVAAGLAAGQRPGGLTITGVTVIDLSGAPSRVANVVVRGTEIVAVGAAGPAADGTTVVDGRGKFLVPGLWDMHVHLATRPEARIAEEVMLPLFLAGGIVGVRDMGGPLDRVLDLRAQVRRGSLPGPGILTPGPFIDGPGDADPLFRRPATPAAAADEAAGLVKAGTDFLKAQAGLAPDVHAALVSAASAAGVALAGHVPVQMSAETIIASGQRSIEHVSPALVGDGLLLMACSSRAAELLAEVRSIERDRGSAAAGDINAREAALRRQVVETYDPAQARALGRSMRDREIWIVPTLVWSASLRPLAPDQDGRDLPMDLVPAALRARWLERRRQFIERQTLESFAAARAVADAAGRAVHDLYLAGAKVLAGTDTYDAFVLPGHSLHQELRLLVDAGFTPVEALRTATVNAAAYRGVSSTEGTVAAGRRADLVVLDANPLLDISHVSRVSATIVGGRLYSRDQLDALVAGVRTFAGK